MYNFTQKHLQLSHRSELCQNKHSFRKHQSWPDNFFPCWVTYFSIFTPLKWNGGPGWVAIIFNMHWGILGAILSLSPKARLVFRSLFVLKSWLSCFRGTATYQVGQFFGVSRPPLLFCNCIVFVLGWLYYKSTDDRWNSLVKDRSVLLPR